MVPIVTPEEMRAIDAAAPEPEAVLIERAGRALAWSARRLLGGTYGRRVVVVAGRGNNGADGRAAARRLAAWGVQVRVVDARTAAGQLAAGDLAAGDLVVDAAYGTGFRGRWDPPAVGPTPVLAADIPSGVDALTGATEGSVLGAVATTTFAALKPGLLFPPGRERAGTVTVADIGLDTSTARAHLVEPADVAAWLPRRAPNAHKWRAALWCVAGSPGMAGAAHLATRAAQRAGAGMVRLSTPGVEHDPLVPTEVVGRALPAEGWASDVLADDRFQAYVVGPGLGRADATVAAVQSFVAAAGRPLVVDGDGLFALARAAEGGAAGVLRGRHAPTVLTPHDGEYAGLRGAPVGADRIASARDLAADLRAVVLLKGPTTVVADPEGAARIVDTGDARLATAGTGDVLSGIIGALLAQGLDAFTAAAGGAWLHGRAAQRGPAVGLVAGDLPDLIPAVLAELEAQAA